MFVLKCQISGYMLQSLKVKRGDQCGVKYKSSFTLNTTDAVSFENEEHANVWCDMINNQSPAPLPYDFGEHTHTKMEVVKVETIQFESEQED